MPSSQLGHCTQLPPFIRHHNTEKKRLRGEPEEGNNNFLLSRPCVCDHSLVCGAMNTHCDDRLSCLVALLLHLLRDKIFLNLSQTKQNINMANPNPKNRSVFQKVNAKLIKIICKICAATHYPCFGAPMAVNNKHVLSFGCRTGNMLRKNINKPACLTAARRLMTHCACENITRCHSVMLTMCGMPGGDVTNPTCYTCVVTTTKCDMNETCEPTLFDASVFTHTLTCNKVHKHIHMVLIVY